MKHLALLLFLLATQAFAGSQDKYIINPLSNGDVITRVRIGSTDTDVVTVDGAAGGVTFGPASTTTTSQPFHFANGGIFAGATGTADANIRQFFGANFHSNTSLTPNRTATAAGGAGIQFVGRTTDTTNAYELLMNQAGDGATDASDVVHTVTQAGRHTIGPLVTGNANGQRHLVSGSIFSTNVTSTSHSGRLALGNNVRISAGRSTHSRSRSTAAYERLLRNGLSSRLRFS